MLKQFTAVFLLFLLFTVTGIQVFHSHHAGPSYDAKKKTDVTKNGIAYFHNTGKDKNCFICDYKLARDIDADYPLIYTAYTASFTNPIAVSLMFPLQYNTTVFETRGPPFSFI